ncbi:MAG: PilT/PilU family type 4a pilus ATPase [Polaromonas sp.]
MNYQETLRRLLQVVVDKSASDLFITTDFPPAIKLNGQLHTLGSQRLTEQDVSQFAEAMTTEQQRDVFSESRELNFAYETESSGRFRVNIMLQKGRGAIVLRRIPSHIETADELGLPAVLKTIALEKRGLVLVAGSTGSGKSTTLASMIDHRNRHSAGHIITIEDPIEFIHDHHKSIVHQREIGMDTESWQAALKNTLRQSPDVIMIGEIRDRETMEQAIAFAETGHLCLATLHSNNANQALDRVINFFPTDRRHQLLHDMSLNLKAVVSQRLIPRRDREGRAPAVEVLVQSPFVSELIVRGEIGGLKELMEKDLQFGMQTFDQSLCELEAAGTISEQTAISYADSANNVRLKIQLRSRQAVIRDEMDNPSMFSVLE